MGSVQLGGGSLGGQRLLEGALSPCRAFWRGAAGGTCERRERDHPAKKEEHRTIGSSTAAPISLHCHKAFPEGELCVLAFVRVTVTT